MALPDVLQYGQSLWLDAINRQLLDSGELARLIEQGIRGITSNPSIFQEGIGGSNAYDAALLALERERPRSSEELYEAVAIHDIKGAADLLRPLYEQSERQDGYVCLEVSPRVAHDTRATLLEARRLWAALQRPNAMIKVPATAEGIAAVQQLLSEGINVNVTLMFGLAAYEQVAQAYLAGLEAFAAHGGEPSRLASVASIFVSRFDSLVDPLLQRAAAGAAAADRPQILALQGKVGIANAKRIYRAYRALSQSPRWKELAARGARPQRILFASTGTKDPQRSDVAYPEALIGPDTVDTLPPATLAAFRDHGRARATLTADMEASEQVLEALEAAGISLSEVSERLLKEGLDKFAAAFDKLLATLAARRQP